MESTTARDYLVRITGGKDVDRAAWEYAVRGADGFEAMAIRAMAAQEVK